MYVVRDTCLWVGEGRGIEVWGCVTDGERVFFVDVCVWCF